MTMHPLRTLSETLAALRQELSALERRLYDELVKRLTETATAERAVKRGDVFPEFALPGADGRFALLSDLLNLGPLVINFYRGQWCPFCSATIEAMSAAAPAIGGAGATVIGISPELGHLSFSGTHKPDLNFTMLCDLDNGVALQCGLAFRLTDDIIQDYVTDGCDLTQINGNGSWFVPIPASYIVMPDRVVSWAYVNPDFRYRINPEEILRALKELRSR
jgi:peroxiredoxin